MSLKEKTLTELENKLDKIERSINKKGLGSEYLSKAERLQRNVNLGVAVGGLTILGVTAWSLLSDSEE